jgi:WD40 repeat protein
MDWPTRKLYALCIALGCILAACGAIYFVAFFNGFPDGSAPVSPPFPIEFETPSAVRALQAHEQYLAAGLIDGSMSLIDFDKKTCNTLALHREKIRCIEFSHDGQSVFSGSSDGQVIRISVSEARKISSMGVNGWINALAATPKKTLILGIDSFEDRGKGREGLIGEWDYEAESPVRRVAIAPSAVTQVMYVAPGDYLIGKMFTEPLTCYRRCDGAILKRFQHGTLGPEILGVSPNNVWLAVGDRDSPPPPYSPSVVRLIRIENGQALGSLMVEEGWGIGAATFSRDTQYIALCSWQGRDTSKRATRIDVYSLPSLRNVYSKVFPAYISSICFFGAHDRLALGGGSPCSKGFLFTMLPAELGMAMAK